MLLVTGATGFVGGEIVKRLIQQARGVRCLVRDPARAPEFLSRHCDSFQGDVLDTESLSRAVRGIAGIVHLVGIIRETKEATFEKMHVQATLNLLRAAQGAGVKRFLHMSALGSRPNAPSRYHQTKWKAEEAVRESGLDYTIFRPSVIFGPEDKFINLLAKMVRSSPILPRFGRGSLQPIWVEDVAMCFARSLDDDLTAGRAFDLGGPKAFRLDELMDLLCSVLEVRKPRLGSPEWMLRAAAAVMELTPKPLLTREQLLMMGEDNVCDIGPMTEAFGIAPRSLEDYLREHLA